MGFGPLDLTGPPGLVKLDQLGSGSVNRPSPAPLTLTLSSSRSHWRPGSPSPGFSGQLRWPPSSPPWAKHSPTCPLPATPNGFAIYLLPEEIGLVSSLGTRRRWSPLFCYLVEPSLLLVVPPPVLVMREYSPVEMPWCGALGVRSVKSSSGSLWPAAQALPFHAVQTSTWATMSVISSPSNLPLLLWPWSTAIWSGSVSQAHKPSYVMLLVDASMLWWF
jgi:hypothetical protein